MANQIDTITVPYIPNVGLDGAMSVSPPSKFDQWLEKDGVRYDLHEIQGARLVWFEDTQEWTDLGWNAIYRRVEK